MRHGFGIRDLKGDSVPSNRLHDACDAVSARDLLSNVRTASSIRVAFRFSPLQTIGQPIF